jgi:hypothetical protein
MEKIVEAMARLREAAEDRAAAPPAEPTPVMHPAATASLAGLPVPPINAGASAEIDAVARRLRDEYDRMVAAGADHPAPGCWPEALGRVQSAEAVVSSALQQEVGVRSDAALPSAPIAERLRWAEPCDAELDGRLEPVLGRMASIERPALRDEEPPPPRAPRSWWRRMRDWFVR